jgi:hypothetical protein
MVLSARMNPSATKTQILTFEPIVATNFASPQVIFLVNIEYIWIPQEFPIRMAYSEFDWLQLVQLSAMWLKGHPESFEYRL